MVLAALILTRVTAQQFDRPIGLPSAARKRTAAVAQVLSE